MPCSHKEYSTNSIGKYMAKEVPQAITDPGSSERDLTGLYSLKQFIYEFQKFRKYFNELSQEMKEVDVWLPGTESKFD